MPLPTALEIIEEPDGLRFRGDPDRRGRRAAIRIAAADVEALAARLAPGTGPVFARLAAAGPSEIDAVARACARAGLRYERYVHDGRLWRMSSRGIPLFRAIEANGRLRVLSALVRSLGRGTAGLLLTEDFTDPADDNDVGYGHTLSIDYESFQPVADLIETRFGLPGAEHLDDRAEAILTALTARGELGPQREPGGNAEWFADLCREAGTRPRVDGLPRRHLVLRAGEMTLEVVLRGSWRPPVICFVEAYRPEADRYGGTEYRVTAPLESAATLATHFEQRLRLTPAPGRPDDRLLACFDAMAAAGNLRAGLPRQANRALVAAWIASSGVAATMEGFGRTEKLLHVHRKSTDCIFELVLTIDRTAPGNGGIVFRENYEYLPRPGDSGREYTYYVRAAYAGLPDLVERLEPVPGEGDPEERLTILLREMVGGGDLADGLDLGVARDRVAAMFQRAGVETESDMSHWISS